MSKTIKRTEERIPREYCLKVKCDKCGKLADYPEYSSGLAYSDWTKKYYNKHMEEWQECSIMVACYVQCFETEEEILIDLCPECFRRMISEFLPHMKDELVK